MSVDRAPAPVHPSPHAEVQRRRTANRRAKASRKINRGRS